MTRALLAAPEDAISTIRDQLSPVPRRTREDVDALVQLLNARAFADRGKAVRELRQSDELSIPALKQAWENPSIPLGTRRQIKVLLDELEGRAPPDGETLRGLRAVVLLEALGGRKDAREVLKRLSQGEPSAWLTREALAAWKRPEPSSTQK